jgi:uncharacterized membrane protein
MNGSGEDRISAVLAYVPVVGWLYVFLLQRKNTLALFHLRQSIGLFLFLILVVVVWAVVAWIIAWIPYAAALSVATFTMVILAFIFGVLAWLMGVINAMSNKAKPLPIFGQRANSLPIR